MGTDSAQTLYLSPGNLVGDTTTLSQGKDLDLREAVAHKKVSSCNPEGIQQERVAGPGAEAAPSGLFTADTSPLAKGMCVQVVYDPNPESGSILKSGFGSRPLWFGLGIFVCWIFSYRRLA